MRPLVAQAFNPQVVVVGVAPTPLSGVQLTQAYIDSLLITLYSTAANSVFIGDSNVTITNGIEIPVGTTIELSIDNMRPLYEIQNPLTALAAKILCAIVKPYEVPFVQWDLTQLFAVAAGNTNITVTALKRAWV